MIPIVTPAEMRAIDAAAPEPLEELIARAGWHVARVARTMMGGVYGRRVAAIAGPGNNGADTRIAAEILRGWGVSVELLAPDATTVPNADLVIDGAYGTGMNRPYQPPLVAESTPVLAVDIPSGLDGLTGELLGDPLVATRTVTFAALKPGLLLGAGPDRCGDIEVVDIGLDVSHATAWEIADVDVVDAMPRRRRDDHKWKHAVYVIGGSPGMYGAPLLAANAALRTGAGMVWCGLPGQQAPAISSEVVFTGLPAERWSEQVAATANRFSAFVVGCGMPAGSGNDVGTTHDVGVMARLDVPTVVDGGGIRALGPQDEVGQFTPQLVLTPHDGEYESLMGERPGPDRFDAARSAAKRTGATVLLKGPVTIVASPDGTCIASTAGDERLATAGTGDVLAGIVGALLAGGVEPALAAAMGAWLHGSAAQTQGLHGFVASDLLAGVGEALGNLAGVADRKRPIGAPDAN